MGEFERAQRVLDQMISMHARLAEERHRAGVSLELGLIGGALALSAGAVYLRRLGDAGQTVSDAVAVFMLFLTVASLVTDLRGVASRHRNAVHQLCDVKAAGRDLTAGSEQRDLEEWLSRYRWVTSATPAIPETSFNRLKAWHLRKVAISKFLSSHPFASPGLLTFRLWLRDNRRGWQAAKGLEHGDK